MVAKYRAKITVHCRGFWVPYKNYCGDQLPCNNYRALPWWLATVQSIPWLPITIHQLLCNTVVAAYRGKRYRDEKSLQRKALFFWDLPICSPWTFRENHSPNIIYTVNRRNQLTAMDLYFLDWVRTRYKTEPGAHTKSAHTVL